MYRKRDVLQSIGDATHEGFAPFVKASDFFTMGSCHQLALALVSAIDGASFVAIYDHAGEHGGETETPRLVHAAAKIGNRILDIEDFIAEPIWIDAWSDLARDANFVEYEPGELPFEFISPAHQSFSERTAALLADHWEKEIAAIMADTPVCRLQTQSAMMAL
jgi:hypothetical protein|nr:hypothetical protein [Neorhizobium tomejilense]